MEITSQPPSPFLGSFELFPQLPVELQDLIWMHAIIAVEPRLITYTHIVDCRSTTETPNSRTVVSRCPVPPLLHACKASRHLSLRSKRWSLSNPQLDDLDLTPVPFPEEKLSADQPRIYFSPDTDVVSLNYRFLASPNPTYAQLFSPLLHPSGRLVSPHFQLAATARKLVRTLVVNFSAMARMSPVEMRVFANAIKDDFDAVEEIVGVWQRDVRGATGGIDLESAWPRVKESIVSEIAKSRGRAIEGNADGEKNRQIEEGFRGGPWTAKVWMKHYDDMNWSAPKFLLVRC